MVHANMAIRDKLSANIGSLRHPPDPLSRNSSNLTTSAPFSAGRKPTAVSSGGAAMLRHSYHVSPNRATSRERERDRDRNRNKKVRKSRKSASQITLTANIDGSTESLSNLAGTPYAVSGVLAGFPRWVDNPRSSDAGSRYDLLTTTLPAKLNKKPMPLPKPKRSPSDASMSACPTSGLSRVYQRSRVLVLDNPDLGGTSDDSVISPYATNNSSESIDSDISPYAISNSQGLGFDRSHRSDNPGFNSGCTSSPIYAVPNKQRHKKPMKDMDVRKNKTSRH